MSSSPSRTYTAENHDRRHRRDDKKGTDTASVSTFASCPPIFVLSTHLDLEELDKIEDSLVKRGAPLTYDISEARLVLGKIGQRKRAALELRARGVWTEEVMVVAGTASEKGRNGIRKERGEKRRRLEATGARKNGSWAPGNVDSVGADDLGSGTETASEDGEMTGQPDTVIRHIRKRTRSISPDSVSVASTVSTVSAISSSSVTQLVEQIDSNVIRVARLDWLDRSLELGRPAPVGPFLVYHGRVVDRPEEDKKNGISPQVRQANGSQILQRAKEDAAMSTPPQSSSARPWSVRRARDHAEPGSQGIQSQRHPPKLWRQTTSEHDEAIPLPPAPDWVKNQVLYACMRSAPLHPPNEQFINQLVKIRKIRELTLDEIGVRAYSTSIASIAAYPYELRSPAELMTLPGCDTKIANLFAEYKQSADGTLSAATALDTDPVLKTLHLFYNIWGVGAKTARDFYYARHWQDLDDVVEHGWHTLSRVQQIGVKYYDEFLEGIPRAEVARIAQVIHRHANLVRPDALYDGRGIDCVVVGGYRRGKEVCGDVDLVLSHRDERVTKNLVADVVSCLESEGWITHTLALHMTTSHRDQQTLPYRGDDQPGKSFDTLDKALVVWQDPNFEDEEEGEGKEQDLELDNVTTRKEPEVDEVPDDENGEGRHTRRTQHKRRRNPNPHRRVDIIISPWRTVGCAVLGWSGDTTFERDLRRYAKKKHGWKFDSSGVRERTSGGQVIDLEHGGKTWEERERLVMEGLGVGWRPATERCTR